MSAWEIFSSVEPAPIFPFIMTNAADKTSVMVDLDSVRSNWRSRGFGCDVWTDRPGQTWENYTHTVDEVVMVLEGDVEFEISGGVLRPSIGEELFIPAGVLHSVRNIGKTTSRWLYGYQSNGSSP